MLRTCLMLRAAVATLLKQAVHVLLCSQVDRAGSTTLVEAV